MRKSFILAIIFQFSVLNFQFAQVASESEMLTPQKVGTDDMIEVLPAEVLDGDYEIAVESSSSMFRIANSVLHVHDGKMSATLAMSGKGYSKLFSGTAEEASSANGAGEILPSSPADTQKTAQNAPVAFEFPVSSLNSPLKCAAFSAKKKKWYDRDILFDASSLPSESLLIYPKKQQKTSLKDGDYLISVELSGGSGRATITSPAKVSVKDGMAQAVIEWSSPNYDYMKVSRQEIEADKKILEEGGNSTFTIPVLVFDEKFPVAADTLAMSTPHEIQYQLKFDSSSAKKDGLKFPKKRGISMIIIAPVIGFVIFQIRKRRQVDGSSEKK